MNPQDYLIHLTLSVFLIIGVYQFYFWCQRNHLAKPRELKLRLDDWIPYQPAWVWIYSFLYYPIILYTNLIVQSPRHFTQSRDQLHAAPGVSDDIFSLFRWWHRKAGAQPTGGATIQSVSSRSCRVLTRARTASPACTFQLPRSRRCISTQPGNLGSHLYRFHRTKLPLHQAALLDRSPCRRRPGAGLRFVCSRWAPSASGNLPI